MTKDRIYIAAWPRSGSKHLGRMIAAAIGERFVVGLPLSRGGRQPDNLIPLVCQTHFSAFHGEYDSPDCFKGSSVVYENLCEDEHLIWNIRDPRDTAVSLWQMGLGKWLPGNCTLTEFLDQWFCREVLNAPDFGPSMSWGTYTQGWLDAARADPRITKVRHEATLRCREGTVRCILGQLGYFPSFRDIRRAIAPEMGRKRMSYSNVFEYTLAGAKEWPKHFDSTTAKILDAHCGDLMRELGYGKESEWLERLE